MHRTLVLSILFFALFGLPVFADQVVLKNGDTLTGTIVDSDAKTLTLKSESVGRVEDSKFVGEVKIQWDAIQSITSSQPLHVTSKDGQTLVGNVTTDWTIVGTGDFNGLRPGPWQHRDPDLQPFS